jgi:hypothetical protein
VISGAHGADVQSGLVDGVAVVEDSLVEVEELLAIVVELVGPDTVLDVMVADFDEVVARVLELAVAPVPVFLGAVSGRA